MVVLKQESRFAKANDQGLSHVRSSSVSVSFHILEKTFLSNLSYWCFASSVQHANRTRYSGCVQVAYLQPFQICRIKRCQVGTGLSLSKVLAES